MKKKEKDPNKLEGKAYLGTTLMAGTQSLVSALMTSYFMIYLTDYSGLGVLAASLGSTLLVFARIFDAVNDPLEGMIVDRAKPGKNGKYKPFIIIANVLMSIGMIGLFFIPSSITAKPVIVTVYVVVFYLLYDIGFSFYMQEPLFRTLTLNSEERGKLLIGPRMMNMLMGIALSALMLIVNAINGSVNNLHNSYGITIIIFVVIAFVISSIGLLFVKEKYIPEKDEEEDVKITDIFKLIRDNDAYRVKMIGGLLGGFVYTLVYAAANYYIKWAYCADLTTGAVDTAKYATMSLIVSMISFSPIILGTLLATPIMKKIGTPDKTVRILYLGQALPLGLAFVLHLVGILPKSPALFFVCLVINSFCMGAAFVPGGVMNMEVMDYDVYKNGVDRSALNFATSKLIEKAQSALATALVGVTLTSVGYIVDSATDTYIGELSKVPTLLTWFVVIIGLIPLILGVAASYVTKFYPITPEIRAEMQKQEQQKAETAE